MSRQKGASKSLTLDKRSKIMIGVLAAVLVIAGAYFMLKKGGSSNSANPSVATPSTSASTSPKASAAPKVTPKVTPSPVAAADSTRDPFVPLVQEAAATTTTDPSGTSSPSPSATTPTAAPTSSAPAAGSHTVLLVKLNGTSADITYNSVDKTVRAGDTIAKGVSVTSITSTAIFINYNDKLYAIAPAQSVTF